VKPATLNGAVSVVMPVRNAAAALKSAADSIRAQTFRRWELLVVDDGSEDATVACAAELAAADPRIRVMPRDHHGIAAALNHGLAEARGDLIARMDSDDISHPERLEEQAAFLSSNPDIGVVGCGVTYAGVPGTRGAGYALHVSWLNTLHTPEQIALNRFIESPLAHPAAMFRRELVCMHGGYREGPFPEDYELWLRWMDAGVRVASIPRELLVWNDSPLRLSRTDPRYGADAFYGLKADYLARAVGRTGHGRAVWIWGAGRPTRRRAGLLECHGVEIAGYIDIDPKKWGRVIAGRPVASPSAMPGPEEAMVLVYVGTRGARDYIRSQLTPRGYVEGRDFWVAA
jgi:glycosyltransferase involved in cell wall biosynthesis